MTNANSTSTQLPTNQPVEDLGDDDQQQPQRPPRREPRKAPSSVDTLAEISRLMRGESTDDQDDDQGDDQGDDQDDDQQQQRSRGAPKTLAQLAKRLGVEVDALYDLEIPLRPGAGKNKGEAKKLSEIKDYFAKQDDHRLDRLQWEETRDREQASIARERAELRELLAAFPADKLNQDVLNNARRKIDSQVQGERRKTLERIPSWQDDDTRASELAGIAEHLADYGFPAVALQGITDHRMLAYMRDNWLRMNRLQAALEKVKPVRVPGTPRSKGNGSAPSQVRPPKGQGSRALDDQVNAVSKLLRG